MYCSHFVDFPIIVNNGIAAPSCGMPHIFTTGGVGWSVKFNFDAAWDAVPHRNVTFWAGHIRKKVPITESAAIIPPEILRIPFVHLRVSICGTDCIPDPESIARAKEIRDRQNEINVEFRECERSEVKALMDEYMALIKERSELNLIKKRYITPWNEIGYIFPGATVPDTRG